MKKGKNTRIILFCLALAIAISAFTAGIMSLTKRERGYRNVEFTAEGNAVLFDSGLHLIYYAEGSSSEIRRIVNNVQKQYTDAALRIYKLTDANKAYDDTVNLSLINASPDRWIQVSEELFDLLKTAYDSSSYGYYSVFAGDLMDQWQTLRYLSEPEDFDPLNNSDKKLLLSELSEWINKDYAFNLEFDDETNNVMYLVSNEYLAWTKLNDIETKALDFNVLRSAIIITYVASALSQSGYTDGYLYTDSGLSYYLNDNSEKLAFSISGCDGDGNAEFAEARFSSPIAFARFTAYAPNEEEYGYYYIEHNDKRIYRHLYPDISDGEYRNIVMTCNVAQSGSNPISLIYILLMINSLDTAEDVYSFVSTLPDDLFVAYTLQNDSPKKLYIKADKSSSISINEGIDAEYISGK